MATKKSKRQGREKRSRLISASMSECRSIFGAVIFFSFCMNLLTLALPIYLVQIYDRVLPNRSVDTLVLLTVIVLIALMTSACLNAIRTGLLTRIGAWIEDRLGPSVLSGVIDSARSGDASSAQGLRDLAQLRKYLSGSSLTPILDAPWTPIFIVVLFFLHPLIGVLTLVGALILFALAWLNEVTTSKSSRESGESWDDVMDDANAIVRNAQTVSAMGMRRQVIDQWQKRNMHALAQQSAVASRTRFLSSTAKFVRYAVQISVMCSAAWLIMNNQLTGGALMATVLLMRRAISPVERSITSWKSFQSARHALSRVDAFLKRDEKLYPSLQVPRGKLELRDVRFYHPKANKPALRKVNFKVRPGEAVAIVGATGAGKSTIARLIVGNAMPYRGHVLLDDIDVTDWDPEMLGPHLGYLPQEVVLFKGSVAENIARMERVTSSSVMRDVVEAARMANVYDLLMDFPEGLDTPVGQDGVMLSGGQRQRVGLARAVFRSPRLVVLDEPDAHLDRDGRKALSEAIKALKKAGSMVVLITHQVKIPQHIDRILRLRQGMIEKVNEDDVKNKSDSKINRSESTTTKLTS